jgi:tetratricopeptide (TPR) repeat protein
MRYFVVFLLTACSTSHRQNLHLTTESPLTLTAKDDSGLVIKKEIDAHQTFELRSKITHLEAPGKIPLLLVQDNLSAITSQNNPWKIELKKVDEWVPAQTNEFLNTEIDTILTQVLESLTDVKRNNQMDKTLARINAILQKYPKVASLYYFKAQVELRASKTQDALKSLDTALSINPLLPGAVKLREKIK